MGVKSFDEWVILGKLRDCKKAYWFGCCGSSKTENALEPSRIQKTQPGTNVNQPGKAVEGKSTQEGTVDWTKTS
jgi:hypothetical protein